MGQQRRISTRFAHRPWRVAMDSTQGSKFRPRWPATRTQSTRRPPRPMVSRFRSQRLRQAPRQTWFIARSTATASLRLPGRIRVTSSKPTIRSSTKENPAKWRDFFVIFHMERLLLSMDCHYHGSLPPSNVQLQMYHLLPCAKDKCTSSYRNIHVRTKNAGLQM